MEKRTILAIAISILILMAFTYINNKYYPPQEQPQAVEDSLPVDQPVEEEPLAPVDTGKPEPVEPTFETDTVAGNLQEIVIERDLYRAVLSNRGAVLTSWVLKDYKSAEGNEFDMVAARDKGESSPWPGSLFFEDSGISNLANSEIYEVTVNGQTYSGSVLTAPVDIVLTLRRGDISIRKTYSFSEDNYIYNLQAEILKGGKELKGTYLLGQDLGPKEESHTGRYGVLQATYFENKVQRKKPPKAEKENVSISNSGNIKWVGLDWHYFTEIVIPDKPLSSFEIRGFDVPDSDRKLLSVKCPFDGSLEYLVYMGPKKRSSLEAVSEYDLSGVINYGFFSILALPLYYAMIWLQQYVTNYGYCIILLTLMLTILLLPLRLKQIHSMKKMQLIQPKVKAIQERYKKYKKTDPKRAEMNQEVMALYKANNVNPMMGCLPLLVQMPLLFAFYSLLGNSIELRQAPFIWWIQDLSLKDPIYVLPIVMGITMFLSQKITPMTAPTTDSQQAKMMQFLPVVFTFFFFQLSSGLNLYFLCSNIFQVGFQKLYDLFISDSKNVRKPTKRKK